MRTFTVTVESNASIIIEEVGGERYTYQHHADNATREPRLRQTHTMYNRRCQSYRDAALAVEQLELRSPQDRLTALANHDRRGQFVAMHVIAIMTMAGF